MRPRVAKTTINDTYDFAIGRRLTNLPALREIGFSANRRLLRVQRLSQDPADGADALAATTDPIITDTGQRVPGLRFTDPRAHALLSAICVFRLLPRGFAHRDLRYHLAPQLGLRPEDMTSGQITYDLRRLRLHGLIDRIPHPPLPRHRPRAAARVVPHPGPHPPVAHRARRDPRTARPDQTPRRRHRLRTRHQRPHPSSPTRRMTTSRT